jgi:hypothetical protein
MKAATLLILALSLVGCGGAGTSSSTPPPPSTPAPDITGQWDFFVVTTTGTVTQFSPVTDLQLQTTTSFFSTPANTLLFDLSPNGPPQLCAFAANGNGCDFPPNLSSPLVVNATLSNPGGSNPWSASVRLPTAGTNTNTYTGNVNLASSPQIQGDTVVGTQNAVFRGVKMPSFSGTYAGNLTTTPLPAGQGLSNFPAAVTMTLTQDQNFSITGTATFTVSGCSQTATISNSAAVGGTAYLNSSTGLAIQLMQAWPGLNADPTDPNPNDHLFALSDVITGAVMTPGQIRVFYTGSICGASGGTLGNGGQGTITKQ